ncbi:MAG: hypothetical protein LC790_15120, partial [Actinobacteria bacterium]|nr:hypothetical protein [Actinomycetota bacterium]
KISFARLDGTGGGDLATGGATVSSPSGVAVDPGAGRVYWANRGAGKISFARLDGTGGGDLAAGGATVSLPEGVALDPGAGRVYWANYGANRISFARLDGTGGGDLATPGASLGGPTFPALLRAPVATGGPVISGGGRVGSTLFCTRGSWAGDLGSAFLFRAPASFGYGWSRDGVAIPGASSGSILASLPGQYRCRVSAANHAGASAQMSAPHTVSAAGLSPSAAPNTRITRARVSSRKRRAVFRFRASVQASGFQCRLKRGRRSARFRRCRSPKTYRRLRPGRYTFQVRATGPGGTDPTPAAKKFRVKRTGH